MADLAQRCFPFLLDPGTGLYDRSTLESRLNEEISRACRYRYPLSLMLVAFDIRQFQQAREWLPVLAEMLKHHTRRADVLSCYGDSALALVLPCTNETGALDLAARIRRLAQVMQPPAQGRIRPVPISIAVASASAGRGVDGLALIEQVESALREAQQQGGDRVIVASRAHVPCGEGNGCPTA